MVGQQVKGWAVLASLGASSVSWHEAMNAAHRFVFKARRTQGFAGVRGVPVDDF